MVQTEIARSARNVQNLPTSRSQPSNSRSPVQISSTNHPRARGSISGKKKEKKKKTRKNPMKREPGAGVFLGNDRLKGSAAKAREPVYVRRARMRAIASRVFCRFCPASRYAVLSLSFLFFSPAPSAASPHPCAPRAGR